MKKRELREIIREVFDEATSDSEGSNIRDAGRSAKGKKKKTSKKKLKEGDGENYFIVWRKVVKNTGIKAIDAAKKDWVISQYYYDEDEAKDYIKKQKSKPLGSRSQYKIEEQPGK